MSGKFFTFPLCALAMPYDEKTILQHAVSHGIERAGAGAGAREIDDGRIQEYLSTHGQSGYDRSARHDQLIRGAVTVNVNMQSLPATIERCDRLTEFVAKHQGRHGVDALVFVAADLLWDCHNDKGLSFREFSALCAINSAISFKKTPMIIRRTMIQARQLGYKTPKVMEAELAAKREKRKPLSIQQLRDTLDNLEKRDLFRRVQAGARTVYFSTTLTRPELIAAVQDRLKNKAKVQNLRQQDREIFRKPVRNQPTPNREPHKEPLK